MANFRYYGDRHYGSVRLFTKQPNAALVLGPFRTSSLCVYLYLIRRYRLTRAHRLAHPIRTGQLSTLGRPPRGIISSSCHNPPRCAAHINLPSCTVTTDELALTQACKRARHSEKKTIPPGSIRRYTPVPPLPRLPLLRDLAILRDVDASDTPAAVLVSDSKKAFLSLVAVSSSEPSSHTLMI